MPLLLPTTFAASNLKLYQMKIAVTIIACIVLTTSCSKDKKEPNAPTASVQGQWRGIIVGNKSLLYNRPNGTTTLYFVPGNSDTTMATMKFNGSYTQTGDDYSARFLAPPTDTIFLEMKLKTANHLSGLFVITNGNAGISEALRLY